MVEADSRQARTMVGLHQKEWIWCPGGCCRKRAQNWEPWEPGGRILSAHFHWVTWSCLPTCPGLAVSPPPFQPWGDGMEMGSVEKMYQKLSTALQESPGCGPG